MKYTLLYRDKISEHKADDQNQTLMAVSNLYHENEEL